MQGLREQHRRGAMEAERDFQIWRSEWLCKREQIALRLALLDGELERLVSSIPSAPHFALVGTDCER